MASGEYTVAGLGARKTALLAAGGTVLDMAIGMLETEHMLVSDYPLGDVDPSGRPKTGDAANFGIFKQNWMMIRASMPAYSGLTPADYLRGQDLNRSLRLDVDTLHASQTRYGLSGGWWAGHRNGATGLANPGTRDISNYRFAVYWIRDQINRNVAFRTNDTRFWVAVPAI